MRPVKINSKQVVNLMNDRIIITVNELAKDLKCSRNTIFNKLLEIEHITCYSHHRKYIALLQNAKFGKIGLWGYNGIWFSKWGGVKPTIEYIVNISENGLTTNEINQTLHIRANMQLGKLVKEEIIFRIKKGRNQIYFSAKETIRDIQIKKRQEIIKEDLKFQYPSNKKMIQILLAIIEHYYATYNDLFNILQLKGIGVEKNFIEWLFNKLADKKNDD